MELGAYVMEVNCSEQHREASVIQVTIKVLPGVDPREVIDRYGADAERQSRTGEGKART